jgi:hypothetical protein
MATVNLTIRLGKVDAAAPVPGEVGVLTKAASEGTIELKNLVLRFTSNLSDTVWDTVASIGGPGIGSPTDNNHTVFVDVELAPLRWWNIEIKTHDLNDSVIHYGNVGPFASKGGQTVDMNIPTINSRFSLYEARYSLPSQIYPSGVPEPDLVYQKIFFSRLVLEIDGQIVRDTSSFSTVISGPGTRFISAGSSLRGAEGRYFFKPYGAIPDTVTHIQAYKYVRTGPRTFTISAYGFLEGDSVAPDRQRLLFRGNVPMTITPGATITELPITLVYIGPGSSAVPPDTSGTPVLPGDPDWTGVSMSVVIGKTGRVSQQVIIPGGVDLF